MELVTLSHGRLEISPYALTINEFKALWERDNSTTKDIATQELSFVYFMVDFKSVYRGYEIKDKVERICKDLNLNSTNILDAEIQLAINKYMEIQQTPTMRLLMDMESCLDKIGFTFRTYNPTTDTNAVKFKALTTAMKSVDGIIKGLNALKETVETETANITRGKGGHRVGKRELPKKRNSDE